MNKKLIFGIGLGMLLSSTAVNAQKTFSEGTISYDIVINTGSDKPQGADFLDGATSAVYIKGSKTRTEMVSSLGTQSTIIDGAKQQIVILKEYGEQRFMINLTMADWKDANKRYENVSFTYDATATKTIQGYKCSKAIGKLADGTTFTVWYTTDLVPENRDFQYANRNLPGVALEYETTMGNFKMTYTVSKINFSPVPAAKFDLPKTGYRVLTYAESGGGN
jgi:GLPGLI family protein